jgi:WD40 repeat protein
MMMDDPRTWFVGQKLNKVRWYSKTSNANGIIAAGSYDGTTNRVYLYGVDCAKETTQDPMQLCSLPTKGGVTDIRFADVHKPMLLVSTTKGCFYMLAIQDLDVYTYEPESIFPTFTPTSLQWEKEPLHRGAMTGMDLWGQYELATVGDDGDVIIVDLLASNPKTLSKGGDGQGHRAVKFISSAEILTASRDIRVWDLRSQSMTAIASDESKGNVFIQSLASHPDQPHYVASGATDGSLTIWDRRNFLWPLQKINAHKDHIWEVKFHPSSPDNIITCSSSQAYLWNFNKTRKNAANFGELLKGDINNDIVTPLLTGQTPFSYNSFDIQDKLNAFVCVGDGGMISLIHPLLPSTAPFSTLLPTSFNNSLGPLSTTLNTSLNLSSSFRSGFNR